MSVDLSYGDALSWLDRHVNVERNSHSDFPPPSLEKVRSALTAIGEPQKTFAAVHITGTNGKGSTARMVSALLMAHGLRTGTYTSPHLNKLNERIMVDLEAISDSDLLDELYTLKLLEDHSGALLTWFELVTAAAFSHFDTVGLDVAVVEVGMGGRWDATNTIDGDVCIITNVSMDHRDVLGPELTDIAREKAGIIKSSSHVVLGVDQEDLVPIFTSMPNQGVARLGTEVVLENSSQAISGRVISVKTRFGFYDNVFVPLFGTHQSENAALAIAAVEQFFGRALDVEVVRAAFERVKSPGRMEVVSRAPLMIFDAAHNPAGMAVARKTLERDFSIVGRWHLVVSMLEGRDPDAMFSAIASEKVESLALAPAGSLRAMAVETMAQGARLAGLESTCFSSVAEAIADATHRCGTGEGVLVCGSIYTIAEARDAIINR